ncbi:MAG: hypothetical protein DME04_09070 [Candidatus Rokuibacteriota bacterium]|nr:MAG: hypothetical protein DME04_09070 [Candidatus Rokubacteria bacterium]
MRLDGAVCAVERRHRVIREQEAQAGIEAGGARLVEGLEAIEPEPGPRAWTHADLQREDLLRELATLVELDQQRPEIGDRVGDGRRMVRVRPTARQRRLEPPARLALPIDEALPEEPIELPDRTPAERCPVLEDGAAGHLVLHGADRRDRVRELVAEALGPRAAHVDRELCERGRLAASAGGVADRDRLTEVRLVLEPVQVKPQAGEHLAVEPTLIEQAGERRDHLAGSGVAGLRQEVDVDDHRAPLNMPTCSCHRKSIFCL